MQPSEILEQIEQLGKREQVIVSKTSQEIKPPFNTIGNGRYNKHFGQTLVVDTLAVFGSLSPTQQTIVLQLRDMMTNNLIQASYQNTQLTNPNEIALSHTCVDDSTQSIKALLRQGSNSKALIDNNVIRKVKPKVYMLNPFMFIPPYRFNETRQLWDSLDKSVVQQSSQPLDTADNAVVSDLIRSTDEIPLNAVEWLLWHE